MLEKRNGRPTAALSESERAELIRLRQDYKDVKSENAQLQMQVSFARKVATWFANDQQ
jgi:transposase